MGCCASEIYQVASAHVSEKVFKFINNLRELISR